MHLIAEFLLVIILLLFTMLDSKDVEDYADPKQDAGNKVEVRAVFINCEPDESRSITENEVTRFEREELFKHGALRNCDKKLALTVKISSEPEEQTPSDEYIPIEHVFEGSRSARRRVRLLDPYVLRLQREPPIEAYKLRKLETVTGVIINTDVQRLEQYYKENRKNRGQRDTNEEKLKNKSDELNSYGSDQEIPQHIHESDPSNEQLSRSRLTTAHYVENVTTSEHCAKGKEACSCENFASAWVRFKRSEHNIRIDHGDAEPSWSFAGQFNSAQNNVKKPIISRSKARNDGSYKKLNSSYRKKGRPRGIQTEPHSIMLDGNKGWDYTTIKSASYYNYEQDNANVLTDYKAYASGSNQEMKIDNTPSDHGQQVYNSNKFYQSDEKKFAFYKVGRPDLWYAVNFQLFEKINSPKGVVWNDLTRGEPAKVGSANPEWMSQDLNIKYRSAEYLTKEDFSLTNTNLYLLLPLHDDEENFMDFTDDSKPVIDNAREIIVVPIDDVITVKNNEKHIKKRIMNHSNLSNFTDETSIPRQRKVIVRTSRAMTSAKDGLKVVADGSDVFLTLPHKRTHITQIDLEARADENQLVHVGSSGRIAIAVTDNTRKTRTTLTVQATNTGLAAARFRVKARECGPELSSWFSENGSDGIATQPVLLPPRHSRRLNIELPTEIPVDIVHCSVALINDDDESVAVRDVAVRKGDRCFCVWHCSCVCLSEDPKLICKEMSASQQAAAGLSVRDRSRRARSVCYQDAMVLNIFGAVIGVLTVFLFLGLVKALLGLAFTCVGIWGLSWIIEPSQLDHYYEKSLCCRTVVYDDLGWPVEPDTKKRNVRVVNRATEFILNLIFFIAVPCMMVWDSMKQICLNKKPPKDSKGRETKSPKRNENNTRDLQKSETGGRRRRRGRRSLRRWMSPHAEELSKDLWCTGLVAEGPVKSDLMRPLLHHQDRPCRLEQFQSYVDSEQDDTDEAIEVSGND